MNKKVLLILSLIGLIAFSGCSDNSYESFTNDCIKNHAKEFTIERVETCYTSEYIGDFESVGFYANCTKTYPDVDKLRLYCEELYLEE